MRRIINLDDDFTVNIIISMKEKTKTNNLAKAFIINAIIATTIMLCTKMAYETNDDYSISLRIAEGYPEVFFVNYYLAQMLIKLQGLFANINIHTALMVFVSFAAMVCVTKIIMDRSKSRVINLVAVIAIAVFSFDHYCTIQFTKTSALLAATAMLLLLHSYTEGGSKAYYLLGLVFLFYGASLRIESLMVALVFAFLYLTKWLIDNRSEMRAILARRRLAGLLVIIIGISGCYALEYASRAMNTGTEALANYNEYNYYRSEIVDYSRLSDYDEHRSEYEAAGFSENDIALIRKWFFDYDGAASKENLAKILEISTGETDKPMTLKKAAKDFYKGTAKSFGVLGFTAIHISILSLLALWLLIIAKKSDKLLVIALGILTLALHIYLYYIQRPAYRATYVTDICAMLWLLYLLSGAPPLSKKWNVPGLAIALLVFLMIVPAYKHTLPIYESAKVRTMSEELETFLRDNSESFYVTATREKKYNPSYLKPLRKPIVELEQNYMGTGSWGTLSPYILDKLGAYGMQNPIKDLIDNPNAYYLGNDNIKKIKAYYRKWYGGNEKDITLEKIGEVEGRKIWKVVSSTLLYP